MTRLALLRMTGSLLLAAFLWSVSLPEESRYQFCGFRWMTGYPCPLCGLTRAMFALAKGHWGQATHLNALSPLGSVMLFSLFWNGAWRAWLWKLGLAAFAVYGICRII